MRRARQPIQRKTLNQQQKVCKSACDLFMDNSFALMSDIATYSRNNNNNHIFFMGQGCDGGRRLFAAQMYLIDLS